MSSRIRVLLIAEACNPKWTSVPLLAYCWYKALRDRISITLVTQIRNRAGFEENGDDLRDIEFIDSEPVAGPLHKLAQVLTLNHPTALGPRGAISWPAYLYFEHLVWKRFRIPLLRGRFDLVHRLTPLSPTFPSPIAALCPVPFVLGPLNGSLPWAPGTEHIRRGEGESLIHVRPFYRALPYWRQTFERSALVIVAARHVRQDLPYRVRRRTVVLAENGVDVDRFSSHGRSPVSKRGPFTILFVGRLVPFKQPALILEAVSRINRNEEDIRVVYVGEGPEHARILKTAKKLGLEEQMRLLGNVPHEQLPMCYRTASVLALPSVHESGGAVLLAAMACGLPCIVVDYGGPSEYVSGSAGIKVPLGNQSDIAAGFARAIEFFLQNPQRLDVRSEAARRLATQRYSWDSKSQAMVGLYHSLLSAQSSATHRGRWCR